MNSMGICIVGAGRMGTLRARSALAHPLCTVVHVVDTNAENAERLAGECDCNWSTSWEAAIARPEVNVVVVSTTHMFLAPITFSAVKLGKHVFCEKPMARNSIEAEKVVRSLKSENGVTELPQVVVGFTLRHHPAALKAHKMLEQGAIGQPYFIRAHYGHGGRPGYDREWRMDKELGGGGE